MTEQLTLDLEARIDGLQVATEETAQRLGTLEADHLPAGQPAGWPTTPAAAGAIKENQGLGPDVLAVDTKPDPKAETTPAARANVDDPPEWVGQRVRIEDLADFKRRFGLQRLGSDWPEGQPCPVVYLVGV